MSKDNKTAGDGKDEAEEFVIVEVDDSGKPINPPAGDADQDEDGDADVDQDEDGDEDEDEQRLGHSEDDETPEARRERRRKDRSSKRVRNRVAAASKDRLIENQGRMLLNLQEQVAKLEGRTVQYDLNLLQTTLQQIEQQQGDAKSVLIKLSKAGDAEGVAEITELQLNLRDQHRETTEKLRRAKAQADSRGNGDGRPAQGRPPQNTAPDPEVIKRAQKWATSFDWANPRTADPEEMAIIKVVDRKLHSEGWDPATDDYWDELTTRLRKRLPHHFKSRPNGGANGGKVNTGSKAANGGPKMAPASQSGARALGKNEVRVTPARKQAMQEAGMWDDPAKRNKMLAQYAKYDRDNTAQS